MIDDPIVEEVHQIREGLATRFQNDLRAYCQHLRAIEVKLHGKVVDLSESQIARNIAMPQKKAS